MLPDAELCQPLRNAHLCPDVIPRKYLGAREIQVDHLVRPRPRQIPGTAHRRGPAAHHGDALRTSQAFMGVVQVCCNVVGRLQGRPPPESVGRSGRDQQHVERLDGLGSVGRRDRHRASVQVGPCQGAVHDPHRVQATEPPETDEVVPRPGVGPRDAHTEFLPADQAVLDRDADDVGVRGQSDGGEDAAVPQPRDDDALAHVRAGSSRRSRRRRAPRRRWSPTTAAS